MDVRVVSHPLGPELTNSSAAMQFSFPNFFFVQIGFSNPAYRLESLMPLLVDPAGAIVVWAIASVYL